MNAARPAITKNSGVSENSDPTSSKKQTRISKPCPCTTCPYSCPSTQGRTNSGASFRPGPKKMKFNQLNEPYRTFRQLSQRPSGKNTTRGRSALANFDGKALCTPSNSIFHSSVFIGSYCPASYAASWSGGISMSLGFTPSSCRMRFIASHASTSPMG